MVAGSERLETDACLVGRVGAARSEPAAARVDVTVAPMPLRCGSCGREAALFQPQATMSPENARAWARTVARVTACGECGGPLEAVTDEPAAAG